MRGRTRRHRGLRVADASSVPNCIRANTNVIAMMIGERVSDFIRQASQGPHGRAEPFLCQHKASVVIWPIVTLLLLALVMCRGSTK